MHIRPLAVAAALAALSSATLAAAPAYLTVDRSTATLIDATAVQSVWAQHLDEKFTRRLARLNPPAKWAFISQVEGGLTAGSSYPVFTTDFGTVGLMICWDTNFADPARALALAGAEVVLVPIAGGNETLVHARAIENRVFLATSGYDIATEVIDPDGKTLARATTDGTVAVATIDLARRYTDPWLGDMRARFRKELRREVR